MEKRLAKAFMNACIGKTCGHMAEIPNNPHIYSLLSACGVCDAGFSARDEEKAFSDFLIEVADSLNGQNND